MNLINAEHYEHIHSQNIVKKAAQVGWNNDSGEVKSIKETIPSSMEEFFYAHDLEHVVG